MYVFAKLHNVSKDYSSNIACGLKLHHVQLNISQLTKPTRTTQRVDSTLQKPTKKKKS